MLNLSRVIVSLSLFICISALATEKIDINSAPLEDLVKIIHIGEVRARELISLRPFSSLDDLTRINGIGEARVEDIKKQGLAWVNTEEPELLVQPEPPAESVDGEEIIYSFGVVINEILPSAEGPDEENEWIEIFNENNFEVDLSDWRITDQLGSIKIYTFPSGTRILPWGYLVLTRPTSKITLNNDGDTLSFIQPNGNIIDTVTYEKAPLGQSYNRTTEGWVWNSNLTPGSENIILAVPGEEKPEVKLSDSEEEKNKQALAAVSWPLLDSQERQISESFFTLLIALSLAVFSATLILLLKKRLNLRYNKNICQDTVMPKQ